MTRVLICILALGLACGDDDARIEGTEVGDCDDGADNDGDSLFDCDDDGCFGAPACDGSDGGRDAAVDSGVDMSFDAGVDGAPPDAASPCADPDPERCDGIDNDCDDAIDEDPSGICPSGEVCMAGSCTCPGGRSCGGACVDTDIDPLNCGGCGITCVEGQGCAGGSCCGLVEETADMLLVIDNSNSMAEEQADLISQMPFLLHVLTTGDLNADGRLDFPPVTDLHLGVITTDMGAGMRDVPTCGEVFGDDGVLRTVGSGAPGCDEEYPPFLSFGGDLDALASDFACVANIGTNGCGFEQQLEAPLKALTPSTFSTRFALDTLGHGDGANAGFVRSDSVLSVVLLTDESDCSAADLDLFNLTSSTYVADLNLRCFTYPEALHPISRYVDGFRALRPTFDRFVFTTIAGVPADLIDDGPVEWDDILSDDRMQERRDPEMTSRLVPACVVPGRTVAFPARRMVSVGRGIESRGATASVGSICNEDLNSVIVGAVRTLSRELVYECASD